MRFAFYGRVSTEDTQDPATSRAWQLRLANDLIKPHGGSVVCEFFDIGASRSLPWERRAEATRLLAAIRSTEREFDAIVVGEPQRAFYGNQFSLTFPVLTYYGVELWVPGVGGRVDPGSEAHELVMTLFGGMSKGERSRVKLRTRAAMHELAKTATHHLGGRPPYGYQLIDAGPHANASKAAAGQRAHMLAPDPNTAPTVERVFTMYTEQRLGLRTIAEILTRDGVPSPSQYDRARNSHRDPRGWAHGAVRAILINPTYTGVRAWGKAEKHETLLDPLNPAAGNVTRMRRTAKADWIVPTTRTHEPLISPELFARAEALFESGRYAERSTKARDTPHSDLYALRGILYCSGCGRRMQGSYRSNRVPGSGRVLYRCNTRSQRALPADLAAAHPSTTVYVREEMITSKLDAWLADFADAEWLATNQQPNAALTARAAALRSRLVEIDGKMRNLLAALEACDPTTIPVVAAQLAARQLEKADVEAELRAQADPGIFSKADVETLLRELGGLTAGLSEATGAERSSIYQTLGVRLAFDPQTRRVTATAEPTRVLAEGLCVPGCVRRGT